MLVSALICSPSNSNIRNAFVVWQGPGWRVVLAHRRYVDTAKLRAAQREFIQHFLRERGVA